MVKLYYAPRTRSVRILWLLEELGLPYELKRVDFIPTARSFFAQSTPLGKLPTIEDGDVVMCESGAIVEYILERYGNGRLAPAVGSPERAAFLQWIHFSESTAFSPIGIIVWLTTYRDDADRHRAILEDAKERAATAIDFIQRGLGEKRYLLGPEFSAADIMMGFTLVAARVFGVLGERHQALAEYLGRLEARPAFQKAAATV